MTTATGASHLELTVSNLGPIAEGKIELRPMSVFVGPSNTGKSYLATLVYALHQCFGAYFNPISHVLPWGQTFGGGRVPFLMPPNDLDLSAEDISSLHSWRNAMRLSMTESGQSMSSRVESKLPETVSELVRRTLASVGQLSTNLDEEVVRCFGIDKTESLVHHPSDGDANFSLCNSATDELGYNDIFRYEFTVNGQGTNIKATIPDLKPIPTVPHFYIQRPSLLSLILSSNDVDDDRAKNSWFYLGALSSSILFWSVAPLGGSAHYLPADRAGVMHAHQVAVRGLIAGASRIALRPNPPMPVLSGVLGDFLERLIWLASGRVHRERDDYDGLALRLEQGLMQGAVRVEGGQIDYPSFVYRPAGWERDLPLMNASSMVSELAPVVLYLRHVVQPGDTLIIEEPESHLHPAMQVEFIRLLAAAVKASIRIIITTHSEWVLEELANLVLMSELPAEHREGIAGAELALNPDEVGAWFFEPNADGSGSSVKEMPLDKEMGNFPSGFGLITTELYNRYARISNRIERLKEG